MPSHRALIVVDVQNDFCEGGSLAVAGGSATAARISDELLGTTSDYDVIAATRDYHIDPGGHFSDNPDYRTSWPPHCRVGTAGVRFHPALKTRAIDDVFSKGQYSDGYSGFEGHDASGESLEHWLRKQSITDVDVVGIATDYCVRVTALDAQAAGFTTRVLLDYTAGVNAATIDTSLRDLRQAGVTLVG